MDVATVVAVFAALLSLGGAVYTTRLQSRLAEESRAKTKAEQLNDLMARYRDPLLRSAFDLQSRLYNIAEIEFLDRWYRDETPETKTYAAENTLYVIADYLAWVEIIRREVRFLDLGDEPANRDWNARLDAVRYTFLTSAIEDPLLRLFNGQQRAIGELMMVPAQSGEERRLESMGYAQFVARLDEPAFDRWFSQLRGDIDTLARDDDHRPERLVALQHALVDLIALLDPEGVRLPREFRTKLESAGTEQPG
jgi:hypothetical protein